MSAITPKQAKEIFKNYIALLYKLVVKEKNDFDLIIGAGDSGAVMAKVAEIFYQKINKKIPPILHLPLQRYAEPGIPHGEYFENKVLIPQIKKQLKNIKLFKKVLFVDDEIMRGWTAKTSIELVLSALPKNKIADRVLYTIVAENHWFQWHYDLPPVSIRYYAFSKKIPGVNGAVFEMISDLEWKSIKLNGMGKRPLLNIILNGVRKSRSGLTPVFTDETAKKLEKNQKFKKLKTKMLRQIDALVTEGIKEYKAGKIKLGFF